MSPLYLGPVGWSLGEPVVLDPSAYAEEVREEVEQLADDFSHYLYAEGPIWASALAASRACLEKAHDRPDLLVYVTQNDRDTTSTLVRIAGDLGLADLPRLVVGGHECGNLGPALQVIADAFGAGRGQRALLVLADHAADADRLMRNRLSVFSDGAAACIVSVAPEPGVVARIDGLAVVVADPVDGQRTSLQEIVAMATAARDRLEQGVPGGSAAARHVLLANYREGSRQFLKATMRLPDAELVDNRRQRTGHCFSADLLISLDELAGTAALPQGSGLVAAAVGPWTWTSLLLQIY